MINGVSDEANDDIEFNGVKLQNSSDIANNFNKYFVASIN